MATPIHDFDFDLTKLSRLVKNYDTHDASMMTEDITIPIVY